MYYMQTSMPYRYASQDSFRYLAHHGIKGQKWGIRRYQNPDGSLTAAGAKRYNAATIGRELNKNERHMATDKTRLAVARMKREKAYNRENDRKVEKYDKKIEKYEARVKDGEKRAKELISVASKKGYSVSSKEVTRIGNKGKTFAAAYFGGIPGLAVKSIIDYKRVSDYGSKYGSEVGGIVRGNKYRVNRN